MGLNVPVFIILLSADKEIYIQKTRYIVHNPESYLHFAWHNVTNICFTKITK